MSGYFKVSMGAAKAIANANEGLGLLAGYMTLASYAYGPKREHTAAGAKAIPWQLDAPTSGQRRF